MIGRGGIVAMAASALLVLVGASPASAVQIGIASANDGPVPADANRAVHVVAGAGENNDVTVRAARPAQAVDPTQLPASSPQVTVSDPNATFDSAPPAGDLPCEVVDPHTARCSAPAGTQFTQAMIFLGDGNNRLHFSSDSQPLREQFTAGDGNDTISTGPFAGDTSYRWSSDTGGGNDVVTIGPVLGQGPCGAPLAGTLCGLALSTGAGNDTVYAANGAFDEVDCGAGNDTLFADVWDSESVYVEPGGSCETRVLPSAG